MNYNDSFDPIERAQRSIFWALAAFALVMVVGTVGYKNFGDDDMTWIDSLYMTFLMVATIGYGAGLEIFHQPNREVFTMAIAFSGIGIMTYFFPASRRWFWPAILTNHCGDDAWTSNSEK